MKLAKLGHSCVVVEVDNTVALYDPGVWSDENLILGLERVDLIVYTHEHPDHFDSELLKRLIDKHPEVKVYCNREITEIITNNKVPIIAEETGKVIEKFSAPHEQLPVPDSTPPAENGYHFAGVFSHPGDSQSFSETKQVLAMPFIGPWGKTGDSIARVLELKPKYVLPIHDWHYTEEAKQWLQGLLRSVLEPSGVKLLDNNIGQEIEIDELK